MTFIALNASEFVEMFVGVGASRVRDLFSQASSCRSCHAGCCLCAAQLALEECRPSHTQIAPPRPLDCSAMLCAALQARANAPAIIFIDEIDSVGRIRCGAQGGLLGVCI